MYNKRLSIAFEHRGVETWPYGGPILIIEGKVGSFQQGYIVDKWVITDRIEFSPEGDANKQPYLDVFDYDAYQIVESYLRRKSASVTVLPYKGEFDE